MEIAFDGSSSILNTVKKLCGVSEEYTVFDQDLLVLINAAILDLTQNGVGPEDGFLVSDASATWDDFIQGFPNPGVIANYISQKVRILFDPPSSSFVLESIQKQLDELIWRINVQAESDS